MSSHTVASAHLALRLLLDPAFTPDPPEVQDQERLCKVAQAGHVFLRVAEQLAARGIPLAPAVSEAAGQERRRVQAAVQAIRQIQRVCAERDVACVFLKSFKHYPDMGGDIDLLVGSRSRTIDRHLERELGFRKETRGFAHAVAGSATYELAACPTPLEIFHGRLGVAGECAAYAAQVTRNRRQVSLAGARFWVPSREDQLLLQALGLVWVRSSVRLSDLVSAVDVLRERNLDWDYLLGAARRLGILTALSCCAGYAEQVHQRLFDRPLLPPDVAPRLDHDRWRWPSFARDGFSLPVRRLVVPLYAARLGAAIRGGDGAGFARLSLVPALGLAALLRRGGRVTRRLRPARPASGADPLARSAAAASAGAVPARGGEPGPGGSGHSRREA
ncbi:MAG: nucleotidyltransferase family protein [Armatimonadota bacterium]